MQVLCLHFKIPSLSYFYAEYYSAGTTDSLNATGNAHFQEIANTSSFNWYSFSNLKSKLPFLRKSC